MAFPTGWARKCIITVPDAQITGTNTNFPVLVTEKNLPPEMLDGGVNSALNGGGDVRFSEDASGAVQLSCEVVSFITGGTPFAEIHVKLPTLNTGADRIFYVWYKKTGEIQPPVTDPYGRNAVWNDYAFVSHDGGVTDSATGTAMVDDGSGVVATGPWGGSALTAPRQRVLDASVGDLTTGFTLQSWINGTGNATYFSRRDASTQQFQSGYWSGTIFLNTTGTGTSIFSYNPVAGWEKIDIVINTPVDVDFYANGVFEANLNRVSITSRPTIPLRIGYRGNGGLGSIGWPFAGLIGECRVVNGVLASGWLITEHNNQSSPATFSTAGTPEAVGGGGITLTVQKISHNISSDALILVQMHNLNVAPSNHNITSLNAALTLGQTVTPNYVEHVSASDGVILFQNQMLVISGNGQAVSSDDVIFLQFQAMIMQNSVHLLSADIAPLFDSASFAPSPSRMQEARRANRSFSNAGELRTIEAINHSTKRI